MTNDGKRRVSQGEFRVFCTLPFLLKCVKKKVFFIMGEPEPSVRQNIREEKQMMRKALSMLCAASMAGMLLAGCGGSGSTTTAAPAASAAETKAEETKAEETKAEETKAEETKAEAQGEGIAKEDLKVGIIFIGDENEGYSASHINGIKAAAEKLGLAEDQVIMKTNIGEDESCLDAAEDLAADGCQLIFATSFGHESYLMEAAQNHPELTFAHATGYQAASSGLDNFSNYFDNIYEARYVSGVVAGMKLKEMIDNGEISAADAKIGYVGAYPYAEVISGFTAFFLGVRSEVPEATMKVLYTNSWADPAAEAETAKQLISDGCVLISQHADTTGAPTSCQEEGVPCVGYNVSMLSVAPDVALTSPTNNWEVYYEEAIQHVLNGEKLPVDWSKGFDVDAVRITELGTAVAEGTEAKVEEVKNALMKGELHVFDTSTFTVDGKTVDTYAPNGVEYIADGYFHESEAISAPAFDMIIDGIESVSN